ncbi:MAG: hypothetical protein KAS32_21460, partial [Candidatus Peribacteraceae bacterium]|nr:hypothetical protein [Candidatus Peribacteraceae bacterium]
MSNDKLKWISKKAFSYFDSKTSITLNASTETGMKTNGFVNFFPMKISFQASDSRMEKTNSRIKVELEYPQVNQLLDSLKKAMSGKNIFKTGATVGVFRYTQKNRKEIVFKFYHDNGPQITMKLSDPTSGAVSTSINLDENIYRTIFKFLTNFSENFNTIDAIYTQTLMSETSSDEIKQKLDNIDKRLLDLESQMKRSKPIYNVSNEGPIEPEEDAPIESTSLQENFNDMVNDTDGFSEVQLEKPFVPTKQSIKSTQPFIDNFLDWDMSKAKEWVASIVCTTDKAKPEYFSPLELVLNICGLDDDKRREYAGDKEFYKSQYIMTKFIKDNVNKALVSQSKYPTSVPAMKFGNTIKRGTQLYDFGIGAATVYLIYSAVVNNYLKLVNTNEVDMIKLDEYQRTLFVLKTILNPMIFSLEITNMFSDDLLAVFSNCVSSGMIDRFQKEYQPVTAGGSLFFSLELFDTMIKKLIGAIEHQPSVDMTDSIALDELMKKYDIG